MKRIINDHWQFFALGVGLLISIFTQVQSYGALREKTNHIFSTVTEIEITTKKNSADINIIKGYIKGKNGVDLDK